MLGLPLSPDEELPDEPLLVELELLEEPEELEELEEPDEFEALDALELSDLASLFASLFVSPFVSLPDDEGEDAAGSPEPFFLA